MTAVIVLIGAGQIGQAIARRVAVGKHLMLADVRLENANAVAQVLGNVGYDMSVVAVDVFRERPCTHSYIKQRV